MDADNTFFSIKGDCSNKEIIVGNVADILIVWIAALLLTNEISFVISCLLMAIVFLSVFKVAKKFICCTFHFRISLWLHVII